MTNMITVHNCETGEIEVRPMNAEELAQVEAFDKEQSRIAKEEQAKAAAKAALLAKLGITEDEAKLLLG